MALLLFRRAPSCCSRRLHAQESLFPTLAYKFQRVWAVIDFDAYEKPFCFANLPMLFQQCFILGSALGLQSREMSGRAPGKFRVIDLCLHITSKWYYSNNSINSSQYWLGYV